MTLIKNMMMILIWKKSINYINKTINRDYISNCFNYNLIKQVFDIYNKYGILEKHFSYYYFEKTKNK